jgi:hypothetical protein
MQGHEDARARLGLDLCKPLLASRTEHVTPRKIFDQTIGCRGITQASSRVGGSEPITHELGDDMAATQWPLGATEMTLGPRRGHFARPANAPAIRRLYSRAGKSDSVLSAPRSCDGWRSRRPVSIIAALPKAFGVRCV